MEFDGIRHDYFRHDFISEFLKLHNLTEMNDQQLYREFAEKYRNIAKNVGVLFRGMHIDALSELKSALSERNLKDSVLVGLAMQDWIVQETIDHQRIEMYPISVQYKLDFCKDLTRMVEQVSRDIEVHERILLETTNCLIKLAEDKSDSMCFMSFEQTNGLDFVVLKAIPDSQLGNTIGLKSWPASFILADFLAENHSEFLAGKRILELGSGCGLVGSMIAKFFNDIESLIVSDFEEIVISNLEYNVKLNANPRNQSKIKVMEIDWFKSLENPQYLSYLEIDVIIASDVIYSPDLVIPFLSVLNSLCQQSQKQIVIANALRNPETFELFMSNLQKFSFSSRYLSAPKSNYFNWKISNSNIILIQLSPQ
jgi:predicted nicotinamide N-methyase